MKRAVAALAFALIAAQPGFAQDGEDVIFQDALLDNMVGSWTLTGGIAGAPTTQAVEVKWVLNHQFLLIHETSVETKPDGTPEYEAMPFIGYDFTDKRYVCHWLDVFGGRYSETLGYGTREGDAIAFIFEEEKSAFRTVFRWDAAAAAWHWEMTQQNEKGEWSEFARMTMTRTGD